MKELPKCYRVFEVVGFQSTIEGTCPYSREGPQMRQNLHMRLILEICRHSQHLAGEC